MATDTPGRAATDPEVLLALRLYANTEGVGSARSAREQEERVEEALRQLLKLSKRYCWFLC